jgi:uncharacterized protein
MPRFTQLTLEDLRRHAISSSLYPPTTLPDAIRRLGFVQADPIRSPARAQDLILRHRVRNYSVGDLETRYPSLDIEEDLLYAYGFMPQSTWQLLHPRSQAALTQDEQRVLQIVSAHNQLHPRELEAYLGREREINAWGGYSKSTTHILQRLHYRGLLRIARRENGIRLYQPTTVQPEPADPDRRVHNLILLVTKILAPIPHRSLLMALQLTARAAPGVWRGSTEVKRLIESGELAAAEVERVLYLWPNKRIQRKEPPETVRFLAPFDPVVWDRRRFEHLWGWPYRFEAYTPPAKRKLGYYAMPLLWRQQVIGWVNANKSQNGAVQVNAGFAKAKPGDAAFRREFDEEVDRFRSFLRLSTS